MRTVNKEYSDFSNRLKQIRTDRGVSQKILAERVGITVPTLSRYENIFIENSESEREKLMIDGVRHNKVFPTIDIAVKLAIELNVSLDWLCGLTKINKEPLSDNIKMLYYLADIIDGNVESWKVAVDVIAYINGEEGKHEDRTNYRSVIYSDEIYFHEFAVEYENARRAGNSLISEYSYTKEIAEELKNKVLKKYEVIFEEKREKGKKNS